MAAVNVKQEVHRVSPGQSNMAADSVDGMDKLGEKSFSAMQGLIMAEDRRMKEKEVNSLQNVSFFPLLVPYIFTDLQIREGIEDNSKIIIFTSQ